MQRQNSGKYIISAILLLVFGLLAVSSLGSNGSSSDPNAWMTEDNSSMAYLMMQKFVEDELKCPSTAEFPRGSVRDYVTSTGDQMYSITSYVDSQNSFGAQIRTGFYGVVQQTSEDSWRLIFLHFTE